MTDATKEEWAEAADRLEEVRDQIEELLADAEMILDECRCGMVAQRAKAYWLAQIADALGSDGRFAMCTMEDTIRELKDGQADD